jgi:hypothetical protein
MEEEEKIRYYQEKIRQEEVGYEGRQKTKERITQEKGKIAMCRGTRYKHAGTSFR